ncbi:MAG: helix-turn-helix transcriptional regulator [Gemmatimonadaceae bacterium]|nr:helix-turn-helix transcriptional regulator [Gemmatimonadaceae bacterium]
MHLLRLTAGRTQQDLAALAGTSQSAIAAYEGHRKSPTWRTVERLAEAAGLDVDLRFVPPLTREERRSLLLHEAVAARLRAEPEAVLVRARASLARMHTLHPGARPLLDEWQCLLRRPLDALLPVLTDRMPWARELRHVTPFTGVLSTAERTQVYRAFAQRERADAPDHAGSLDHAS